MMLLEGKKVPDKLSRALPTAGMGCCAAPMLRWSRMVPGLAIFRGFLGSWGHTGGKWLGLFVKP